ncbi:hypothetical protein [Bacillus taeanensis]|uniref:Uncharacterized protein n=1 Tax=Bacillus taeanensis TaxID=273032 RepID=A0A366XVJ5_9BACI|nr:hypothetical protein [Bacillus taeanensis]RBW67971.1 hypothetical protein DS031_19390 [Bacillus taeanensis]
MNGRLITAFFSGSLLGLVTGIVLLRIFNEKEDEEQLAFLYPSFRAIWTPLEAFGIYFEECSENGKLYMRLRSAKKSSCFK